MWIFVKLSSFLQALEVFTLSNDKSDRKIQISNFLDKLSLRKKCPYSELFWPACFPNLSVFSPNAGKCGKMRTTITPNTNAFYAMSLEADLPPAL